MLTSNSAKKRKSVSWPDFLIPINVLFVKYLFVQVEFTMARCLGVPIESDPAMMDGLLPFKFPFSGVLETWQVHSPSLGQLRPM